MKINELISLLDQGDADNALLSLYDTEDISFQRTRYLNAALEFSRLFGEDRDVTVYSVSGRTEITGNHTDHNFGRVIAGSLDLDIIAFATRRNDNIICVKSQGFSEDTVNFDEYSLPDPEKFNTSAALIAGVCAKMKENGHRVGGFDAYTTSNVLKGSGMSSSAAFENMIGNILNHLYNDGELDDLEIAMISQYAENVFFGKPCGLMDQVACAVGGMVSIDLEDPQKPLIEKIDFDLSAAGYSLCIVNTGGNHADLGEDYTSVPAEMRAVAGFFGKTSLRQTDEEEVMKNIPALREAVGDRAIMRALHFFGENRRVIAIKEALQVGNIDGFFDAILASGRSSFCYLQNAFTTKNVREQGISLALCLAEKYLSEKKAAYRVHGGGFAGTIQVFLPKEEAAGFKKYMEAAFGQGSCPILNIRPYGAVKVI